MTPVLQPGAYVLLREYPDPLRIHRVSGGLLYFVVNEREFAISRNRIRWVIEGYINSTEIRNLWVEVDDPNLITETPVDV